MARDIALIQPNESVFIPGRTGSGKSYLAQKYLARYPAVIALDTKQDLNWSEVPKNELQVITKIEELPYAASGEKCKVVYSPDLSELQPEFYESFFEYCYKRKNCIVWVDEAMSICPNSFRIPEFYKGILTRGRSRNTAVWSLTQRPSGIPPIIMSESKHFFVFDLNLPQDREKVSDITGAVEIRQKPDQYARDKLHLKGQHYFWYYYITWENARLGHLS